MDVYLTMFIFVDTAFLLIWYGRVPGYSLQSCRIFTIELVFIYKSHQITWSQLCRHPLGKYLIKCNPFAAETRSCLQCFVLSTTILRHVIRAK